MPPPTSRPHAGRPGQGPTPARVAPLGTLLAQMRDAGDPMADIAEDLVHAVELAQSIALARFPDAPLGSRPHVDVTLALLGHIVSLSSLVDYRSEQDDAYGEAEDPASPEEPGEQGYSDEP